MAAAGHVLRARYKASLDMSVSTADGRMGFRLTPMATRESLDFGLVGWF
jgi:hypothetical protein